MRIPAGSAPRVALALLIGTCGGWLFYLLHLPLAWMLGAMCATTVAALAGVQLAFSLPLRAAMVAVLGALLGSSFTPEVLGQAVQWLGAVAVMAGYASAISALAFAWLHGPGGLDTVTSYFAATPGGFGEMTIIGESFGGDPRIIPLVHAMRVLIVVFSVPLYLRYVEGLDLPRTAGIGSGPGATPLELALLSVGAAAGFLIARRLRIPSAQLLGPMVVSAAAYLAGVVDGRPPSALIAVAQVVIGSAVGARFVGMELRRVARPVLFAAGSSVLMLVAADLTARLMAPVLGIGHHGLLLALAPGGLAEMALIALSLDVDAAFVSTMHLVRIMLIVVLAPFVFRMVRRGA